MTTPLPGKNAQAMSQTAVDTYVMDKALRDSGKGSMWIPSCRLIAVKMSDGSHQIKCADGIIDRVKALFGWGGYSFDFDRIYQVANELQLNTSTKPSETAASFDQIKAKWDEGKDQNYRIWNLMQNILQSSGSSLENLQINSFVKTYDSSNPDQVKQFKEYFSNLGGREGLKSLLENGNKAAIEAFCLQHKNNPSWVSVINETTINARSGELGTPLYLAFQRKDRDIVEMLQRYGADRNISYGQEGQPISHVMEMSKWLIHGDMQALYKSFDGAIEIGGLICCKNDDKTVCIQAKECYEANKKDEGIVSISNDQVKINGKDIQDIKDEAVLNQAQAMLIRLQIDQLLKAKQSDIPHHTEQAIKVGDHYLAKTTKGSEPEETILFIQDEAAWNGREGKSISFNMTTQTVWIDGSPKAPDLATLRLVEEILLAPKQERIEVTGARGTVSGWMTRDGLIERQENQLKEGALKALNLSGQRYEGAIEMALREKHMKGVLSVTRQGGNVVCTIDEFPEKLAARLRVLLGDVVIKIDKEKHQVILNEELYVSLINRLGDAEAVSANTRVQTPSKIRELLASTQAAEVTFDGLVNKSIEVYKAAAPAARNLTANKITSVGKTSELKAEIVENAKKVRPILHEKVVVLCEDFLAFKSIHGTVEEQALYKGMKVEDFIERLMTKRPMMFMTASDSYLLRNGRSGAGGFDIGAHGLNDYISYEEIEIAALIGISVPAHFVNKGDRNNSGKEGPPGSFAERGVYQGLVGARFELPTQMESKYMLISASQNTQANGYGKEGVQKAGLDHWKKFYGVDHFASFEEAKNDKTGRFIPVGAAYLDTQVYRARMKATIEVSLLDANRQGEIAGQKAYIHAVGLGIGVWAKNKDVQARIMVELYREVIGEKQLPYVGDIDFSWFPGSVTKCGEVQNGQVIQDGANAIKIHFSKRSPADPVPKDRLLVAQYAWDGNSFPGNEYWQGLLDASGDPAAACCSTISEMQTPQINEAAAKTIVVVS